MNFLLSTRELPGANRIAIAVHGDFTIEANEVFSVRLSGATGGAHITRAQGTGRILNDDTHQVPDVMIGDASLVELRLARRQALQREAREKEDACGSLRRLLHELPQLHRQRQ